MRLLILALSPVLGFAAVNCHKNHASRDYKMTEMGPPPRISGIGDSHLEITTKSAKAQAYFDQGFNLLHCFWDFEAYRAFKEAARLDPNAAMAYWGIVQAISDYPAMEDIKKAALEKAKALMDKASDHEQFYIRAQQAKQDEDDGDKQYRAEMEALIDKYPDDIDAKLFLAIQSAAATRKKTAAPRTTPSMRACWCRTCWRGIPIAPPPIITGFIFWKPARIRRKRAWTPMHCRSSRRLRPHGPHAWPHLLPAGRLRSRAAIVSRFHESGFRLHAARKGRHAG